MDFLLGDIKKKVTPYERGRIRVNDSGREKNFK